jgi:hypothetical protein
MQLLQSEGPRDAIGGVEWMESSLLLAWTCWGERAGGTESDIQGLCVIIRGAVSIDGRRRRCVCRLEIAMLPAVHVGKWTGVHVVC